jgi:hypothetical protein
MKALGVAGFLLLLTAIPLAQYCINDYNLYAEQQRKADQEAIGCENTICLGLGLTAADARQNFDASMHYLLADLLVAPAGILLVGLNWRELLGERR